MSIIEELSDEALTEILAYTGLVFVAFELVKSLVVKPTKFFYKDVSFGEGMPFRSYEEDVLSRHKNEFEACLLYLRDFMEAIESEDLLAIQSLRKHRNDLAHQLAGQLHKLEIQSFLPMLEKAEKALFKLSNYQAYIEIGSDPKFKALGIDWDTFKGHEYSLYEEIVKKVKILGARRSDT